MKKDPGTASEKIVRRGAKSCSTTQPDPGRDLLDAPQGIQMGGDPERTPAGTLIDTKDPETILGDSREGKEMKPVEISKPIHLRSVLERRHPGEEKGPLPPEERGPRFRGL